MTALSGPCQVDRARSPRGFPGHRFAHPPLRGRPKKRVHLAHASGVDEPAIASDPGNRHDGSAAELAQHGIIIFLAQRRERPIQFEAGTGKDHGSSIAQRRLATFLQRRLKVGRGP